MSPTKRRGEGSDRPVAWQRLQDDRCQLTVKLSIIYDAQGFALYIEGCLNRLCLFLTPRLANR